MTGTDFLMTKMDLLLSGADFLMTKMDLLLSGADFLMTETDLLASGSMPLEPCICQGCPSRWAQIGG